MGKNEFDDFKSIGWERKTEVLFNYLVKGHNMEDIAVMFYLGDARKVSHITRGYGFHKKNSGVFGKRFTNETGIEVTVDDIAAYVKQYPDPKELRRGRNEGYVHLHNFLLSHYKQAMDTPTNFTPTSSFGTDHQNNFSSQSNQNSQPASISNKDDFLSILIGGGVVLAILWFAGKWLLGWLLGHPIVLLIIFALLVAGYFAD